jgi:hypothetical protein
VRPGSGFLCWRFVDKPFGCFRGLLLHRAKYYMPWLEEANVSIREDGLVCLDRASSQCMEVIETQWRLTHRASSPGSYWEAGAGEYGA